MAINNIGIDWLGTMGSLGVGVNLDNSSENPGTSMSQYEQMDRTNATLKRNPKMELSKNDLIKLVSYFEGEIQARDIVIATLKSERLKQIVNVGRYRPVVLADPYTALLRDSVADGPNAKSPITEKEMAQAAEQQLQTFEQLILQQRCSHQHMMDILKEAENKHKKVIQELEEEKCKHERDTAQGDDITYGLELERTRLKQELETEKNTRKKLEKELKRQLEVSDEERARQKQIVLLLLSERKNIIAKYVEERKRSEDLGQILSEEKSRIDAMAEGLEEESKKSLQMEAELEKQLHIYENEKKSLRDQLSEKEDRCQELETELQKLKAEFDIWRDISSVPNDGSAAMISSVAKVVQPTATVSSVPVSGPTTGIAQSVLPGQVLRQPAIASSLNISIKLTTTSASPTPVSAQPALIRAPPKVGNYQAQFQPPSVVPHTLPKKNPSSARGMPPPVPPNKPVIPSKAPSMARRPDSDEVEKKKPNVPLKDGEPLRPSQGIEMLGQELADFQQMFVTMATSNNT